MAGLVTVVTFFPFVRTTFMIMISQTTVATLITWLFRGWGTEGLASFLGLGFLFGLDLDNKSTGFDSFPP